MAGDRFPGALQDGFMKTAAFQCCDNAALEQEAPFQFSELFFSRTDERGRILSGNSVFQRISQYSWAELIGKPHNIIRHPDMPRAVFWLFWDTIRRGEPIGAYVKNRTKDGRYYWVFAIVTPIEGGYLSVRLKPSSPLLQTAVQEYRALAEAEAQKELKPAGGGKMLLDRIAQLGYRDYMAFMSSALAQEIVAREARLNRLASQEIPLFEALGEAASKLLKQAEVIFETYATNRYIPMNLRIRTAKLGQAGATIGVISVNYSIVSADIKTSMDKLVASAQKVADAVAKGLFLFCTARLQEETAGFFRAETSSGEAAFQNEMKYLDQQQRTYRQSAAEGLRDIAGQARLFHQACDEMQKLAARLEVTRIMANVEIARLSGAHAGLHSLSASLAQFQASISSGLSEIASLSQSIQANTQRLFELTEGRKRRAA